jgi:hypothetical protein
MAQPEPLLAIAGLVVFSVATLTVLLIAPRAELTMPTVLLLALTSLVALLMAQPEPLLAIAGLVVLPMATLTVPLLAPRALLTMLTALLLALTGLVALVVVLTLSLLSPTRVTTQFRARAFPTISAITLALINR